ncbi:general secretion pathway protein LspH [Legionella lansingensis]|uniref:Type II secretion system protein H n=1 Tax=Legionella lansingensis TaxID=45067 RepID=A0A0W0VJY0_9GAMM|nr:type II secretion system minor pseudopilin GspH [Legionella lansingensis]KTD20416.1 general secretion pathway protein LspH [Legionella lansingensis]SNV50053.1 general secretion pathway protein LspH [Legionella lansingensis]
MHAKGFTLIEILVVVIIISITIGFALLTFGDFGASRRALMTAEQFSTYIKLVEQQAILEMTTLGIDVRQDGYQTLRFTQGKTWTAMPEKSLFHTRHFPDHVVVKPQSKLKNNSKNPDILIDSSGDLTPFVLNIGTMQKPVIATLIGKRNGEIILTFPKAS